MKTILFTGFAATLSTHLLFSGPMTQRAAST